MLSIDVEENGEVRSFDLQDGEYLVGRALEADIRLVTGTVSRRHARIRIDGDHLWVRDLGTYWGTWVDTRRLEAAEEIEAYPQALLRFAHIPAWRHGVDKSARAWVTDAVKTTRRRPVSSISAIGWSRKQSLPMLRHLFHLLVADPTGHGIEQDGVLFLKDWIDADNICLLCADEPGMHPDPRACWSRDPIESHPLDVDLGTVDRALRESAPVICEIDEQHVAAIPMCTDPRTRGVMYAMRKKTKKAFNEEDVELIVAATCAIAARRSNHSGSVALAEAARIQLQMLPPKPPALEGYDLDAYLQTCLGVGGDFYDFIPRSDGTVLIVVADVAGKGLSAALASGAALFVIRTLADLPVPVLELHRRLHGILLERFPENRFVALFLGQLHPRRGDLECVVAGIPLPVILRYSGDIEYVPPTAWPPGMAELGIPSTSVMTHLEAGDLLAVFSDGYPEATSDPGRAREFGLDRLLAQLVQNRAMALHEIHDRLDACADEFVAPQGPSDDRTLLLLRRNA